MCPVYEYECEMCKRYTTRVMSINDNVKEIKCEKCGNPASKVVSLSSFKVNGYNEKNGYAGNKN